MSGFQFYREECFARVQSQAAPTGKVGVARQSDGGRLSARDVIAEAIREHGAAPHVDHPQPARCLYGIEADELLCWYDQIESCADDIRVTTKAGVEKRQRSDVPILMGVVASYPGRANDGDKQYVEWRIETLEFMRKRYGDNLASVLEHTDEEHGHIHALVADRGRPVKLLAAGFSAMQSAAAGGASKKEQAAAYQSGGRALQDAYFDQVASKVGLARIGPKKRRLTRREWNAEQAANDAMAKATRIARKKIDDAALATATAKHMNIQIEEAKKVVREGAKANDDAARILKNRAARVTVDGSDRKELSALRVENKLLADDLNAAQNELSSLKKRLKRAPN